MATEPSAPVIDLMPLITKRRQLSCKHERVVVGDPEPTLECRDCGSAVDPWNYIRRLADMWQQWRDWVDAHKAAVAHQTQENAKWVTQTNALRQRLLDEIHHLQRVRNDLTREQINGQSLGTLAARRRPRRKK